MTIREYLRLLRDQWVVVVIALVLGLAGAATLHLRDLGRGAALRRGQRFPLDPI